MDGHPVKQGDFVHDILLGAGVVKWADASQILVSFGTGEITYGPEGHYGAARRLYWSDPIYEAPPKRDAKRELIQELIRTVRRHV